MTGTPPPSGDWVLCTGCAMPLYGRRLARDLGVCSHCGAHLSLAADRRLAQLADGGRYELLDVAPGDDDPLGFTDTRPYPERLADARRRTGLPEAVLCARLSVAGTDAVVAAMDFRFLGGSLGVAVGRAIVLATEVALAERLPFVVVTASGGARMQEGALALMQMATTAAAMERLDRAGLLTVSVITDPTYGGVAASFATLADVILAEPGARLGFAGRRVIEQTIREVLPPGFQSVERLLGQGFVDRVVPRPRLRDELGEVLRWATGHRRRPAAAAPGTTTTGTATTGTTTTGTTTTGTTTTGTATAPTAAGRPVDALGPVVSDPAALASPDPWRQVREARRLDRPTTTDYLGLAFEGFRELRGDRCSGDCPALVGGIAWLEGRPLVVIGHQKGSDPAELVRRNFGMPQPAGYRKAARLMRLAGKLGLPVVTLVDTPGAHPGRAAEDGGQAVAIAECLRAMAALDVPVVSVVTGEGGSGGALALAVADRALMFSDAVYSVISPEGCASILWRDAARAPEAASALRVTATELLALGVVDGVVPEPEGGAGAAPERAADALRLAVSRCLDELGRAGPGSRRARRRARFRAIGHPPGHPLAPPPDTTGIPGAPEAARPLVTPGAG